jgi:hypothetical protein
VQNKFSVVTHPKGARLRMRSGFRSWLFWQFRRLRVGHRRVCGALSGSCPVFFGCGEKHKIPPPYSRADDSARSLNGRRDDVSNLVPEELPGAGLRAEESDGLRSQGMMTIESGFVRQYLLLLFRRHHVINHMNDSVGSHRVRNFEHAHIIVIVLDH